MQPTRSVDSSNPAYLRIRLWYALLALVLGVFVIRLFYLQVIRHDYYAKTALAGQLKEYELPAERGTIEAYDGDQVLPIVLNETKYPLFADPKYVKDSAKVAAEVQKIIGGNQVDYETKMKTNTRYAVLAKKLSEDQKKQLDDLNEKGIGTRAESYRTYPQGDLGAQVLGFVNDEGQGTYGVEQAMNNDLKGEPGQLRAITDAQGVPLVANQDNIITAAEKGKKVVLTIDISMQKQLEELLRSGLEAAKSKSGSALVLDPYSGAVKAMANFPSYNPAEFYKVEDPSLFTNAAVSAPLEIGSTMKVLTAAAALDQGVVQANTTYFDPSHYSVDGYTIKNIEEDGGAGTRSVADILQLSLNTGATWLLMQMGGGEVNEKGRVAWHDYMVNHYHLGQVTGIEQGYEAEGTIPDPKKGFGLNLQYANTAFGQGMTATPLQMGAALSAVINGGSYYKPRLVDRLVDSKGKASLKKPEVISHGTVKADVSQTMVNLMSYTFDKNHVNYGMPNPRPGYVIGGKTGTAEVPKPGGGYYDDRFNGTFMGFVGGDHPQYVIVVRVDEPKIAGYAGSKAAAPIFSRITNMLIDSIGVTPKRN